MRLRTQIIGFGLAGALAAALAGGIGLAGAGWLGQALDHAVHSGQALQASQEGDMMHDAIRADAQAAVLASLQRQPEAIDAIEAALKEHVQTFDEALKRLRGADLPPDALKALDQVEPVVREYVTAAQTAVRAARDSPQATTAAMASLGTRFTAVEQQMAALSDLIEQQGAEVHAQADGRQRQVNLALAITLALCTVAMVVAGAWLARYIAAPLDHAVSVADRLSEGQLDMAIQPHGNHETQHLLQAMQRMQGALAEIVRSVKLGADEVASASLQIAHGNQDLAQRTVSEASALEQTASTMARLGDTVRHNADNAQQASQLAAGASDVARNGGTVMAQVVQTMQGIHDSSRRIADIIGVIDGIAFQTNILALNAAVEAARAGEAGRGFAVVASEVRSLAGRSGLAAREIKQLVGTSVERVEEGASLVGQAGRTMQDIVGAIQRVTDIVGEISSASAEQRSGVEQVGQAVAGLDQSTQQNAALVEQSAAAAESLNHRAQGLVAAVAAFRLGADGGAPMRADSRLPVPA